MRPESERVPELSIVVVASVHADDLVELHAGLDAAVEKLDLEAEFIYLVRADFERALDEVRTVVERDPARVHVLRFPTSLDEPAALASILPRTRGQLVATLPPYFDADPECLADLVDSIRSGADLVVAARGDRGADWIHRTRSRLFNRAMSIATGTRLTDIASRTRMIRRAVLDEVPLYGDLQHHLPVLADRLGFSVREQTVASDRRAGSPASLRTAAYLWRAIDILTLFFLTRFTRRPLRLFGAVGAGFSALGAGVLSVATVQRFLGTPMADRPILVLGVLLLGAGVQLFTIGLLGELLVFFHSREIPEYRLAAVYEESGLATPETPGEASE